jgi:hypothetical protein
LVIPAGERARVGAGDAGERRAEPIDSGRACSSSLLDRPAIRHSAAPSGPRLGRLRDFGWQAATAELDVELNEFEREREPVLERATKRREQRSESACLALGQWRL